MEPKNEVTPSWRACAGLTVSNVPTGVAKAITVRRGARQYF